MFCLWFWIPISIRKTQNTKYKTYRLGEYERGNQNPTNITKTVQNFINYKFLFDKHPSFGWTFVRHHRSITQNHSGLDTYSLRSLYLVFHSSILASPTMTDWLWLTFTSVMWFYLITWNLIYYDSIINGKEEEMIVLGWAI